MEESTQSRLLIRRHSNQFHAEFFLPRPTDDGKVPTHGLSDEIDTDPYRISFVHGQRAPDAASFQGQIDHQSPSSLSVGGGLRPAGSKADSAEISNSLS
jgi:hypothetical protein